MQSSFLLNNKEPFFAGRFGHTELNMIVQVMNVRYGKQEEYEQAALKQLNTNAGFFPENMQLGREFVDLMLRELPYLDLHGIWPLYMEDYMIRRYESKNVKLTRLGNLEPFHVSRKSKTKPWSYALGGKKVLVIHPFADTIKKQYSYHREQIFSRVLDAKDILPEFELLTLKAVQTIAGNKDSRFGTWFEALDWMKKECARIDFDVAIIGCGAYGFPLAAEIKRMGKIAIHMGGGLQLLFGICGGRWESGDYAWYQDMVNDSWVRPCGDEIVKNNKIIDYPYSNALVVATCIFYGYEDYIKEDESHRWFLQNVGV